MSNRISPNPSVELVEYSSWNGVAAGERESIVIVSVLERTRLPLDFAEIVTDHSVPLDS